MNIVLDVEPLHDLTGRSDDPDRTTTLIDDLLAEQRQLTAVESFSRRHHQLHKESGRRYRSLLPAAPPSHGQQYAFESISTAAPGARPV